MRECKVKVLDILIYALYFSIFKAYFIPNTIRQILKLLIILAVFCFLISKLPKKRLLNISILFSACIIISGLVNYTGGSYTLKALLDSFLYSLCFYDLYTMIFYCYYKKQMPHLLRCLQNITLIYCVLTFISVLIVGVENNSNTSAYLFGNKFSSSYFFLLLIALFGATHNMKKRKYKCVYFGIEIFALWFSLHVMCVTTTVALVALVIISLLPQHIRKILINPKVVVVTLISSAVILLFFETLLHVAFINNIVLNIFNKSYTIAGRLVIYNNYLLDMIRSKFLFGYGYSNGQLILLTGGVFSNAQNGLFEQFVNFGIVGIASLIYTTYYCFKKPIRGEKTFYLSLIVDAMIIAAVVEVTLNWFFLLGLCLVRWSDYNNQ